MASRSVWVCFINFTPYTLSWQPGEPESGIWNSSPPALVSPNSAVIFENDSDGFMTGAAGSANFNVQGPPYGLTCDITWDDPFVGSNSFSTSCTQPGLAIGWQGNIQGRNIYIVVSLICSSN